MGTVLLFPGSLEPLTFGRELDPGKSPRSLIQGSFWELQETLGSKLGKHRQHLPSAERERCDRGGERQGCLPWEGVSEHSLEGAS